MAKELSEMTLDELWQLFPIFLTEHKVCWKEWFDDEKKVLESFLPDDCIISHIGSTAIDNIWAKPIVDILIEVSDEVDFLVVKSAFLENGYVCMSEDDNRISFNKGYTKDGFAKKVFHLHVRHYGDNDEIVFRNYMNRHPETAKEYEKLKLKLWKKFEHNRDGYTQAKTEFISKCMSKAKYEDELKVIELLATL